MGSVCFLSAEADKVRIAEGSVGNHDISRPRGSRSLSAHRSYQEAIWNIDLICGKAIWKMLFFRMLYVT